MEAEAQGAAPESHRALKKGRQRRQDARAVPGTPRALAIDRRLAQTPERVRRTYLRAVGGRSLAAGVKAFCLECVGWKRVEVTACTALACPLWPYRPFQAQHSGSEGDVQP